MGIVQFLLHGRPKESKPETGEKSRKPQEHQLLTTAEPTFILRADHSAQPPFAIM
ncbi:hypothetical protein KIN20_007947 [Parelaphostrongylus tenuis]|uniref:Uncharacterized protein n=1 Tax=Parelaphostrongylus tenuis TaxID=148309 RepID=A0AAD5MQA8_PARTN|nr:hypothetical protein KIN20_007947 [Parelaphostrongylus tenuis]